MAVKVREIKVAISDDDILLFLHNAGIPGLNADTQEIETVELEADDTGEKTLVVTVNDKG